jgi:AcrR family transcriptional regulator
MPRKSAAVAAQTRDDLLATARKLFADRGYTAATTAEIAARAGVTEGALFHHFTSKKAVFQAVFDGLESALTHAAARAAKTPEPRDAFLAGCRVYLDFAERDPMARIVMIDAPAVLGPAGWRRRDSSLGLAAVTAGVEAMMKSGALAHQPARPLAVLLLGALNEAGMALARKEPGLTARSCIAALKSLIAG